MDKENDLVAEDEDYLEVTGKLTGATRDSNVTPIKVNSLVVMPTDIDDFDKDIIEEEDPTEEDELHSATDSEIEGDEKKDFQNFC